MRVLTTTRLPLSIRCMIMTTEPLHDLLPVAWNYFICKLILRRGIRTVAVTKYTEGETKWFTSVTPQDSSTDHISLWLAVFNTQFRSDPLTEWTTAMQETFFTSICMCQFYFENLDVVPHVLSSVPPRLSLFFLPVYVLEVSVFDSSSVCHLCVLTSLHIFDPWVLFFSFCYLHQVWLPFVVWTFCCIEDLELRI